MRSQKFGRAALRDSAELILAKHQGHLSNEAIASFSAVAGLNNLMLGDRGRARTQLWHAARLKPLRWRYWLRLLQASVVRRHRTTRKR